jgi:hypothetical protein
LLTFLTKFGPIALNSLMIINTKLSWNEGGKEGTPSHVYGYSLGFGNLELIFFFVNVLFMCFAVTFAMLLFILPVCCAGMFNLCCKANALDKVKTCGRGYLVMSLYVLSLWGLITTLLSSFLKYYRVIGLDIPASPSVALQAFPIFDLLMTLIMFPPNIGIQLGSKISLVKAAAVLRLAKVAAVCFPIIIDVFLQILEWKHSGPPSKCCQKCFPCCGQDNRASRGSSADANNDLEQGEKSDGRMAESSSEELGAKQDDPSPEIKETLASALEDVPPIESKESLVISKGLADNGAESTEAIAEKVEEKAEKAEKEEKERKEKAAKEAKEGASTEGVDGDAEEEKVARI